VIFLPDIEEELVKVDGWPHQGSVHLLEWWMGVYLDA